MVVNLTKGGVVNLSKQAPGLRNVVVGLGWDPVKSGLFKRSANIDCDAFAFVLKNGKLKSSSDNIYFGNLTHSSGAVKHMGDNLTGDGDGDDEQIFIKLDSVPADCNEIVIGVNIYSAKTRHQNFGQIDNAFVRLVDNMNGAEICRYNLSREAGYADATTVVFGSLVKMGGEWEFKALGEPSKAGSIGELSREYM
jgi:stress response protein SCP2